MIYVCIFIYLFIYLHHIRDIFTVNNSRRNNDEDGEKMCYCTIAVII